MRILITAIRHQVDLPTGSSRIAHDEAQGFARAGHEVWVLAPSVETNCTEHEAAGNYHLLRYAAPKLAAWHPSRRTAHQAASTALLKKYLPSIDLVHGHAPLTYQAALHLYGDSPRKCYTVHSPVRMEMQLNYESDGFWRKVTSSTALAALEKIERECLEKSDLVTALSHFTVRSLAQIHGQHITKTIEVIPGWVDSERFVPANDVSGAKRTVGWPIDIPTFFTLRRFTPRMGLDRLLQAASGLKSRGIRFRLVVAGDGPLRGELENRASALELGDYVQFAGRVTDTQLIAMYQACDAFVLPTRALECFGLIAIEALATGKTVLATPVGAIPEVLSNFEGRWLSQSAEASSLEQTLEAFIDHRLPIHNAQDLHEKAQAIYGKTKILPELLKAVQGENLVANRRQRILIMLAPYLPGYRSGGPVQSIAKMIELLGPQFDFFVLTSDRDTGDSHAYENVRIGEWQDVGNAKVFYSKSLNLRVIRRAIREADPDILYLHSFYDKLTNKVLLLRKADPLARLPVVLAPRGEFSSGALSLKSAKKRIFRSLSKLARLHEDVIWHASSETEKADIVAHLGTAPVVLARTPAYLTEEELKAVSPKPVKSPGAIRLIFAARISPMKNLHYLADILREVQGSVDFEVCGPVDPKDESYWARCREQFEGLPPHVKVHFRGGLPHAEALSAITRSHLFILPTLGENFGHSIAESLLTGTPVMISDKTPWRDLGRNDAGFDLPLSDRSAWVRALQSVIDCGPSEYLTMQNGAREFMQAYSLQESIFEFNKLFLTPLEDQTQLAKKAVFQ